MAHFTSSIPQIAAVYAGNAVYRISLLPAELAIREFSHAVDTMKGRYQLPNSDVVYRYNDVDYAWCVEEPTVIPFRNAQMAHECAKNF